MEGAFAQERQEAEEARAELQRQLALARDNPEAKQWEQLSAQLMATREEREAAREQLSAYTEQLMQ
eukprot:1909124-Prymnesium_polylepis.1